MRAAGSAETAGELLTDAARGAGNDDDLAAEVHFNAPGGPAQITCSVRGSIRCILLRSATSDIDSPAAPAADGLDAPAHLDTPDDEVDHRLHAHRLDHVEPDRERHRSGRRVAARFGNVLRTQAEQEFIANIRAIARLMGCRDWEGQLVGEADGQAAAILDKSARKQVHRR